MKITTLLLSTLAAVSHAQLSAGSGRVVGLNLIQGGSNAVVSNLVNGTVVTLPSGDTPNFSVDALVAGSPISFVQFVYKGVNARAEYTAPYAMCGNMGPNYTKCDVFGLGTHTISARVAENMASTFTVTFTIAAMNQPTKAPVRLPSKAPTRQPTSAPVPAPRSPLAPTPGGLNPFQPIRINCGGNAYTDTRGRSWSADRFFASAFNYNYSNFNLEISDTLDDFIYRSERYGAFTYSIPVSSPGSYTVTLHFAEIYLTAPGQRVFDVDVEGIAVPDIDVVQLSGGVANKAITRAIPSVGVTDGTITIRFMDNVPKIDNPKIAGIEITAAGTSSTRTPTPAPRPLVTSAPIVRLTTKAPVPKAPVPVPTPTTNSGIAGFKLVHSPTNVEVMDLFNGAVVDPVALNVSPRFNVRAVASPGTLVQSIRFFPSTRNETSQPWAYCGDSGGAYFFCSDLRVSGTYTITARPFTGKFQSGSALPDVTVTFSIAGGSIFPVPSPVKAPTKAPVALAPTKAPQFPPTASPVSKAPALPTTLSPVKPFQTIRVNCGGDAYTDTEDRTWSADVYYLGGRTASITSANILDTQEDTLYHSERFGIHTYEIPVPLGTFEAILYFAEIGFTSIGQRVFDVDVEGTIIPNIDIVRLGGGVANKAIKRETAVSVEDGFLTIRFLENVPMIGDAKISAIEVKLLGPHYAHSVSGGPYIAVDTDGDGFGLVPVDAAGSHTHGEGQELTSFTWKKGSAVIGTGQVTTLRLPVGEHDVALTVVDSSGDVNLEKTTITVYDSAYPSLATLSPTTGTIAGGTVITLTGSAFGSATAVRFGLTTLSGSGITVLSATSIRVISPASGVGFPVDVSVVTPRGESNTQTFTYVGTTPVSFASTFLMNFTAPTAIAFGPDGKLYLGNTLGQLGRFTMNDSFDRITGSVIKTITTSNRGIHGIAFDPLEGADVAFPTVYISTSDIFHGESNDSIGLAINGRIQSVRGSNLDQVTTLVSGLPVSSYDHSVNGIYFGNAGELYITVGSNTNGGLPGKLSPSQLMRENYLSASILVAHLGRPGFNGFITYNTRNDGAPITGIGPNGVEIFAHGLRNPYGVVLHSNGQLYATDNGPNPDFGDMTTGCGPGESVPGVFERDKLVRLVKGAYYGHPNLKRAVTDPRQCVWRRATLPSNADWNYTAPMMRISSSTNGIIEFETNHFNGQLRGNLIMSKYEGSLFRVILSPDGLSIAPGSNPAIAMVGNNGLAVTQAPNGNLFDTQHKHNSLFLHIPNEIVSDVVFVVKAVWPRRGGLVGGTPLSIYGTNFAGSPIVKVGSSDCINVDVVSRTLIRCRLPASTTVGAQDVVVSINGMSDTLERGYRYILGRPTTR